MRGVNFPIQFLCACSALALSPQAGWAQSATEGVADEQGGEILVTANRRSESSQKVAASIAAVSGDALASMKIDNPGMLSSVVPGLNVNLPNGAGSPPIFTLRGISANDFSFSQSRPIALYEDDAIRASPVFEAIPFFDVQRVETLKGPQGALYGKNATGGAINIVSKAPGFDTEGYLTAGYGNYNERSAQGAVQTALVNDVLATRFAFTYQKNDGYVRNVFPGSNNSDQADVFGARLSFLLKPSSLFDATVRLSYNRSAGGNAGYYADVPDPSLTAGVSRAGLSFWENNNNRVASKLLENYGANLQLNVKLDHATITSITAVDRGEWLSTTDDDGLPISVAEVQSNARNGKSFSQELRVVTAFDGPFNVTAGGSYGSDSMKLDQNYMLLNSALLGAVDPFGFGTGGYGANYGSVFTQRRNGWAIFGRGEFKITPSLTATGGIRYSDDRVAIENFNSFISSNPGTGVPNLDTPTIVNENRKARYHNTSFEAGLQWAVANDVMTYASFKQGYRTGAFNAQAFFSPDEINAVQPETVNSYEVGLKSQLFGRRLTFNLAGFFVDYRHQQVLNVNPSTGLSTLANVNARIYGLEGEVRLKVVDGITVNTAFSWVDPRYRKGAELNGVLDANGTTIPGTGIAIGGNQMAGAARFNAQAGVDVDLAKTGYGTVRLQLDGAFASRIYFDAYQNNLVSTGPRWVQNARLSLESDHFTLAAYARNIFKEKYFVNGIDLRGLGFIQFVRGAPQTYGAEITYRF